jgi:preprotein translocase subunit SecF
MEFFKTTPRIPFMANRRKFYGLSLLMILGSFVLLATRGLNLGIDFTGGAELQLGYPEAVDVEQQRALIVQAGFPGATVTEFGSDRDLLVRVRTTNDTDVTQAIDGIMQAVRAATPGVTLKGSDSTGSQVGKELTEQGGLALLFTFLLILVYVGIRFEKKMAAGTVFAAMHDPIVILGFFSATQITFDLSVLAAVLAVIGYSINDTVVVFDRVREVFHLNRNDSPAANIDAAVNQTLSRTMMTSFSTLFVVVSLYLFGGEALKGFSLAIIVGVFVGTFSSVFVAGALAMDMRLNVRDFFPVHKDKAELDALP